MNVFRSDEFVLQIPKLGRLERIRIGHDNSGFGPGWFLDKVSALTVCHLIFHLLDIVL